MFNKVIMVGNLTRDIELKYTPNGMAIAKSAIATNRKYKSQTGEQKEETCFIDITLFGRAAEIANQYLKKGRKVLIEGRLILEQWVDNTGQKRSKHSIAVDNLQMLDKSDTQPNYQTQNAQVDNLQEYNPQNNKEIIPEIDINDDEIPF